MGLSPLPPRQVLKLPRAGAPALAARGKSWIEPPSTFGWSAAGVWLRSSWPSLWFWPCCYWSAAWPALVEPLPVAGWLLAGLLVALWLRWFYVWLLGHDLAPPLPNWALAWLAPALACLLALLLWLPGTRGVAPLGFAAIVAIGSSRWGGLMRPQTPPVESPADRFHDEHEDQDEESAQADLADEEPPGELSPLAPSAVQQLIRRRQPGQAESISGSLRADFAAGQRTVSAHVAICPPFERAPRCQAAVAAGPPAEVRVATSLPFGVRLEVKLAQPAIEPTSVVVELAIDATDGEQG